MSDRELLELAAKAIGEKFDSGHITVNGQEFEWKEWSPLTDDGDALRLAVKLGIIVCVLYETGMCGIHLPGERGKFYPWEPLGDDPYAATRRAIVRAAAEIRRSIP